MTENVLEQSWPKILEEFWGTCRNLGSYKKALIWLIHEDSIAGCLMLLIFEVLRFKDFHSMQENEFDFHTSDFDELLFCWYESNVHYRACNPENQSRDPGIHFKSQSRDLKLIGILGLKSSIFGPILAHFWLFLVNF